MAQQNTGATQATHFKPSSSSHNTRETEHLRSINSNITVDHTLPQKTVTTPQHPISQKSLNITHNKFIQQFKHRVSSSNISRSHSSQYIGQAAAAPFTFHQAVHKFIQHSVHISIHKQFIIQQAHRTCITSPCLHSISRPSSAQSQVHNTSSHIFIQFKQSGTWRGQSHTVTASGNSCSVIHHPRSSSKHSARSYQSRSSPFTHVNTVLKHSSQHSATHSQQRHQHNMPHRHYITISTRKIQHFTQHTQASQVEFHQKKISIKHNINEFTTHNIAQDTSTHRQQGSIHQGCSFHTPKTENRHRPTIIHKRSTSAKHTFSIHSAQPHFTRRTQQQIFIQFHSIHIQFRQVQVSHQFTPSAGRHKVHHSTISAHSINISSSTSGTQKGGMQQGVRQQFTSIHSRHKAFQGVHKQSASQANRWRGRGEAFSNTRPRHYIHNQLINAFSYTFHSQLQVQQGQFITGIQQHIITHRGRTSIKSVAGAAASSHSHQQSSHTAAKGQSGFSRCWSMFPSLEAVP